MRSSSVLLCFALFFFFTFTAAGRAAHAEPTGQTATADTTVQYERQAVGVRHVVPLGRDGSPRDTPEGARARAPWDAFQGLDHHPLDEETFFRIVGRDDLVRRFHRELVVKNSLLAGGGVLIVGGLSFATIMETSGRANAADIRPGYSPPGPSPAWGLAAAGAGLVSLIVGHLLDPSPIGADEADRLARDYDQTLRAGLGINQTAWRD
jgi:hypothetical protein